MRRALLFFSLLSTAAVAQLPRAGTLDGLGMNIHFTDARPGELEMLSASGARWVRMDFSWGATEKTKGEYDFARYEHLLADLDRFALRAVFILDYGNKLYGDGGAVRTAEARGAFAAWSAAAVKHFAGRGVLWEIWNEPNGGFWKPTADVREYTAMALAACSSIRAAAPGEPIIGPATSTIDIAFLEGCFQAGLLQYWDAVSVHPYRQEGPESVVAEYARLRRLILRYAPAGKKIPILSGEWGYSSVWKNHDETSQGKMLARQWLLHLSHGIPLSIWYDWHDDGPDPKEAEHHFGSVHHPYHAGAAALYEPKPAYLAAQTLTGELKGYEFVKRLAVGGVDDYVLAFRRGDDWKLALWTTLGAAHNFGFMALGADPVTALASHLGEPLPLAGVRLLSVGDAPVYLSCPGNKSLATVPAALPLRATPQPLGDKMQVRVEKLIDLPLQAQVSVVSRGLPKSPVPAGESLALPDGVWEQTLTFPLAAGNLAASHSVLHFENPEGARLDLLLPTYFQAPASLFTTAKVRADGNPAVTSEQRLEAAAAPAPWPGGETDTLRLTYRLGAGWKFLQVGATAPPAERAIPGRPTSFGLWIYGDGQGGQPRLRVLDSAGQTFQPSGARIDWKGWRYVHFDLRPSTAHWGGQPDGQIHYPLRWDTLLILDKDPSQEIAGELYFTAPYECGPAD